MRRLRGLWRHLEDFLHGGFRAIGEAALAAAVLAAATAGGAVCRLNQPVVGTGQGSRCARVEDGLCSHRNLLAAIVGTGLSRRAKGSPPVVKES
jgi:hypothetical protein